MRLQFAYQRSTIPRLFPEDISVRWGKCRGISRLKGLFTQQIALAAPHGTHVGPDQAEKRWFSHRQTPIFVNSTAFSHMSEKPPGNFSWKPICGVPRSFAPVMISGSPTILPTRCGTALLSILAHARALLRPAMQGEQVIRA